MYNEIQMENRTIDKVTSNKISFMTIIPAFADAYKMNNVQDAFLSKKV